jgi:hypothetical protein
MEAGQNKSTYTRDDAGLGIDEKIASLFQPDTLIEAQYFDNLRRNTLFEPEKRLIWAILEDAIHSFQDNMWSQDRRGKRLFEQAEEWITKTGRDWIFSFENVCETLGFNPEYVRQGLLRWKEKNRQQQSHRSLWEGQKLAG